MPPHETVVDHMNAQGLSFPGADILRVIGNDTALHRVTDHEAAGPCPVCRGTDRFRVSLDRNLAVCSHCHDRNGHWLNPVNYLMWRFGLDYPEAADRLTRLSLGPLPVISPPPVQATKHGPVLATYDYRDEAGTLLYQVLRHLPKSFSQRRPDGLGGWIYKLGDTRRVLYRLPELLAAPDAVVFVCEGEKDVDALVSLGLVATCNPGGAGNWRPSYGEALRDRQVMLLPDKDQVGRDHAELVRSRLTGVAAEVSILELPGEGKDVSDWLAAGGTCAQLLSLLFALLRKGDRVLAEAPVNFTDVQSPYNRDNHTSVKLSAGPLGRQLADLQAHHAALLAQSAEQEGRIAQLSAELAEAHRLLDRVASEAPFATIARLEERVAELTQEKTELLALARDTAIAPVSRIVGIVAKEAGHAYRPLGNLSRDGPAAEPVAQRIHVGSLEVEAGIGRGTFSRYIREVAERGHVGYIVQPDYGREEGQPRSTAFLLPGAAVSTFVVSTRKQKAKDRAAEERAKLLARAEQHAARVAELEAALARAQADGCPHCGGDLLPTGYFCPSCREDHATEELARIGGSFHRRPPPVTFTDNIYKKKAVNSAPCASPEESTGYGPDGDQPFWGSG